MRFVFVIGVLNSFLMVTVAAVTYGAVWRNGGWAIGAFSQARLDPTIESVCAVTLRPASIWEERVHWRCARRSDEQMPKETCSTDVSFCNVQGCPRVRGSNMPPIQRPPQTPACCPLERLGLWQLRCHDYASSGVKNMQQYVDPGFHGSFE